MTLLRAPRVPYRLINYNTLIITFFNFLLPKTISRVVDSHFVDFKEVTMCVCICIASTYVSDHILLLQRYKFHLISGSNDLKTVFANY